MRYSRAPLTLTWIVHGARVKSGFHHQISQLQIINESESRSALNDRGRECPWAHVLLGANGETHRRFVRYYYCGATSSSVARSDPCFPIGNCRVSQICFRTCAAWKPSQSCSKEWLNYTGSQTGFGQNFGLSHGMCANVQFLIQSLYICLVCNRFYFEILHGGFNVEPWPI